MSEPQLAQIWKSLDEPISGDIESDWCQAPNYYEVYRAIGRALQPTTILEIGARIGHSLIALSIDNPRLHRITWIDNESYVSGSNAMAAVNIAGTFLRFRPTWRQPELSWSDSLLNASLPPGFFELCHVDGEHTYDGKIRDLEFCANLKPNWLLVDDFSYHGEVQRATLDWTNRAGLKLYVIDTLRGLALIPIYQPLESQTLKLLMLQGSISVRIST